MHQAGSLTLLSVALMYWHTLRRSGNAGRVMSRHALAPSVIQRAPFRQFAAVNPPQFVPDSEPELPPLEDDFEIVDEAEAPRSEPGLRTH